MNIDIRLPDRYNLRFTDKATLEDVIAALNTFEIDVPGYVVTAQLLNSPGIELTKLDNDEDNEQG